MNSYSLFLLCFRERVSRHIRPIDSFNAFNSISLCFAQFAPIIRHIVRTLISLIKGFS